MIVEVFFISNATELQAVQDKTWLLAQAIADEAVA
jgi:N-acetylmuramoyl-L-alanine amidase